MVILRMNLYIIIIICERIIFHENTHKKSNRQPLNKNAAFKCQQVSRIGEYLDVEGENTEILMNVKYLP